MSKQLIQPWDGDTPASSSKTNVDTYIPPAIEKLAQAVSKKYAMKVYDRKLITSKPDKGGAIWKIDTDKGPRSLKLLHREPARSLFSVGAQEYLVKRGARVPALVRTKDKQLYVEKGGKVWIVTKWIEPLKQTSKVDLHGAEQLCYGLGEFHKLSKGYVPPEGAVIASRLYRWPKYYTKIVNKMGWFREVAKLYKEIPTSQKLLSVIDSFEQQARKALSELKKSPYEKMVKKGEKHWGLVHQDYGWSNGQMGPGGLWVIDLDGVAYDLPIRDLRKLITSTMDDMGVWDLQWIRGMINAYHKANPIDAQTYKILLIDMAMPNEFYKHVKEMLFEPKLFLETEMDAVLDQVLRTEKTKWQALKELHKDRKKFANKKYVNAKKDRKKLKFSTDTDGLGKPERSREA